MHSKETVVKTVLTQKGEPVKGSNFSFLDLLLQQLVVLKPDCNGALPNYLPNPFFLIPKFKNGNLSLNISQYPAPAPPGIPGWTVYNAMINSQCGISIVLQGPLGTMLALSGARSDPNQAAKGTWISGSPANPAECTGDWTFTPCSDPKPDFPWFFSWTFLITYDANPGDSDTVVFEFEANGSGGHWSLQQVGPSFPPGWEARDPDISPGGISLTLTGPPPECNQFELTTGLFSGGLGALVCQGHWCPVVPCDQHSKQETAPLDGGNWTGTSGGP